MNSKEISHEIVSNYFIQVFHEIEVREYTKTLLPELFKKTIDQIVLNSLYFGVPLSVLLKRTNNQIPRIVPDCIEFLTSKNLLNREGLFRISGSLSRINKVIDLYNEKGEEFELLNHEGIWEHEVAGILKKWFRDMPGSIFTTELKDKFLQCGNQKEQQMVFGLNTLLLQLPTVNQEILKQLMVFLHVVSKHTANKMNVQNLTLLFSPTLFDLWLSGHMQAGTILKSMIGNPLLYWDVKIDLSDLEEEKEKKIELQNEKNENCELCADKADGIYYGESEEEEDDEKTVSIPATVLYDFDKQDENDLEVKTGQEITIVQLFEEWVIAVDSESNKGIVPRAYLEFEIENN
ncbi:rho gtpase-activating protein 68f [Anaeramoeba flamelloides]|uniref:Rho gtpase-activating protein 68f n=1 Tax=Anaeramoeba flamelloides TaxID=1746091 RepID=A0AAV7ZED7_9EUKA|nr:rho gtpase-activating protein 68f [Anaeramoeba flamelloides]